MATHIAVILTDAAKRIIWVNDDFTSITGYTLTEVMGRKPGHLLQGPDTDLEAVHRIRKSLQQQVPLKDQLINYRKSGEPYLCKLVIYPVFDQSQTLTNFIAFEIDGDMTPDDKDIPLLQLRDKYRTSSLRGVEEIKLFQRLKQLMEKDRLFLDSNLTLKRIADRLATNTKYLSQVVNHQTGMNFQHFLNHYRVEEAKNRIMDEGLHNLTLYGIALQCGFKNKSTFFKVFKELTDMTPKEYIKTRQESLMS